MDSKRLPLGRLGFSNIRKQGKIYVDKTKLISKIAEQDTPIFFSRPRRFGKSLLINTLHSLFEKGLEDFHELDLEKTWHDGTYKVVHFDFSRMINDTFDFNYKLSKKIIQQFSGNNSDFKESDLQYPDMILDEISQKISDYSIVLLIDEYDAPLTHNIDKQNKIEDITNTLNNFYATIKQYTDKFRFIFITGITRTSHVSIFSAFNNLLDITLEDEFNDLLGFTKDNLIQYFDGYIEDSAHVLKMSKGDIYKRLEQYYDGFQFALEASETVFNPWSVLSFFKLPKKGFKNYWFDSGGTPSIIINYCKIDNYFDIFNGRDREILKTKKEITAKYEISKIPYEILLLQAGYLTIRKETIQTARLTFPNTEVEDSMLDLYMTANNIKIHDDVQRQIDMLSEYIDNKNIIGIVEIFNAILNDCVSIHSTIFQDERSIRDIIYAALPQEVYLQKIKERETTKGFSDLELLTQKTHMVIEFKRTNQSRDASACLQEAVEQMRSKKYGIGAFKNHTLYRVAMVISAESKEIITLQEIC